MSYKLEGLAKEIHEGKYKNKNDVGILGTWDRVATAIASIETDKELWRAEFNKLLYDFNFIPGGRTTAGAGTKNNYLNNCKVLPISDSIDEIYETVKKAAISAKCNFGIGINFSGIRPKNSEVSKGGTASGPVSFMKVFDASGSIIETGGGRRAAALGLLNVNHPDIFEFIDAKREEGTLTQFNISVNISDKFLKAVKNNENFDLEWGGKVHRTVKAKDIWDKLIYSGYHYNDPGIFCSDRVNFYNNGWYLYEIEAANACGELPLPPYAVCCLGNINGTKFITNPFTDYVGIDWVNLKNTVHTAVRFLDNVLDVSDYPFEETKERVFGDRRIGLNGVAGLGDVLAMLKLRYDSHEGLKTAEEIQKFVKEEAYRASIDLAIERGPFPNFDCEKYMQGNFIKELPEEIQEGIRKHGIRNIALLTCAPVGTGSLLAGNISNGLEPIFALEYNRQVRQMDGSKKTEAVEDYAWKLYKTLSKPDGDRPAYFRTAREITPKAHVDMQTTLQKHIDGAISKTANIPENYTIKEYEDLFMYAIDSGVKGFTSFREGTREGVLSTNPEPEKKVQHKVEDKIKPVDKKKRPRILTGNTYKLKDDLSNIYVTINNIEEKGKVRPFEIFINSNGGNSQYAPWYRAMGKLMSAVMRRTDDCSFLVTDLQSIYGQSGYFSDGTYVQSQPQMVGNVLQEHLDSLNPNQETIVKHLKCPECGEMSYIREGGCSKCLSCSYSTCG